MKKIILSTLIVLILLFPGISGASSEACRISCIYTSAIRVGEIDPQERVYTSGVLGSGIITSSPGTGSSIPGNIKTSHIKTSRVSPHGSITSSGITAGNIVTSGIVTSGIVTSNIHTSQIVTSALITGVPLTQIPYTGYTLTTSHAVLGSIILLLSALVIKKGKKVLQSARMIRFRKMQLKRYA